MRAIQVIIFQVWDLFALEKAVHTPSGNEAIGKLSYFFSIYKQNDYVLGYFQ